jgi:hypothetical protein
MRVLTDALRGASFAERVATAERRLSWRRGLAVLALALGATFVHGGYASESARAAAASSEFTADGEDPDAVKSAFVYHFATRHVKWPDSAHKTKTSAFVIGVLGDDTIVPSLIEACRARKSGEHPIHVRTITELEDATDCHILVIPPMREVSLPALLRICKARPVLLVSGSEESVRRGAHLALTLEKARMRITADPTAAKAAGLEISSELLKLARVIERDEGGAE